MAETWRSRLVQQSVLVVVMGVTAGFACSRGPQTPEEKRAHADQLLRKMSDKVAAVKVFSFTGNVVREHVKTNGQKVEERTTQHWIVRRPNAFTVAVKGPERDFAYFYDGKRITMIANRQKKYAQGPVPPTIDDTLDFIATHYDVPSPMADLLYSSPYDALMTPETKGGWVGAETVEGQRTDHLAMQDDVVDWDIWINDQFLAPQFQITYKQDPGQPKARYTFTDFNPAPQVTDETFTPKIPDGYERLKLVLREGAPIPEPTSSETASPPARQPAPAAKPK